MSILQIILLAMVGAWGVWMCSFAMMLVIDWNQSQRRHEEWVKAWNTPPPDPTTYVCRPDQPKVTYHGES